MISIKTASSGCIRIDLWKFTLNARGDIARYSDEWGDFQVFGWFHLYFGDYTLLALGRVNFVKYLIETFDFRCFRDGGFSLEVGQLLILAIATLDPGGAYPFGWLDVIFRKRAILQLGYKQRWITNDFVAYKFRIGESMNEIAHYFGCTVVEVEHMIRQELQGK